MISKPLLTVFFAVAGLVGAGASIAACVGDGVPMGGNTVADSGTDGAPTSTLKTNGIACSIANECSSGICADGVCCDTACDGICEKCSLAGTVGTCSPIPDATDPDNECPTIPLPTDAGAPDGGDDGGTAGDGGTADAGPDFVLPDGGLPATTDTQCAGHCNGKRACAFAPTTTQCGTAFCGDPLEEGVAQCDGAGHCLYGIQECSAYTCPSGAPGCKTSCAADTDCLTGYYCDPSTHSCLQKLANGTACTDLTQCQSSVCDSTAHVCCNVDCSSTPGGTCAHTGDIGTCVCDACPTGACGLFYPDTDHDGYGDATATAETAGISGQKAVYGCAAGPAPSGYAASNTDCLDSSSPIASSVNPGQTGYFTTSYTNAQGTPSFDYDCSGTEDKGTPDGENACYTCAFSEFREAHTSIIPIHEFCTEFASCGSVGQPAGHSCEDVNGTCGPNNDPVFYSTVACGQSGYLSTCNSCTSTTSGPTPSYATSPTTMACH